jgi:hypothetical protein
LNFYAYQRPVGKIDDCAELRDEFIAVFDEKSKEDSVRFGLRYGEHLIEITGIEPRAEILEAFGALQEWLDGTANYHKARNIAFQHLYATAREGNDPILLKFYKTMAQIACIPHVKFHALWATDFAITLINSLHPGNLAAVKKERETQIALLKNA